MITKKHVSIVWLFLIQLAFGYEWLFAAWEKFATKGAFVTNMPKTLEFLASRNPFGWYKAFLSGFAIKNATAFGYLVEYGQLLIGIGLILAAFIFLFNSNKLWQKISLKVSALSYFFGAVMSAAFWLAAAWTSVEARSANMIMFWAQVILLVAFCGLCHKIKKETV